MATHIPDIGEEEPDVRVLAPERPCRKMERGHPLQAALEVPATGVADTPWRPVAAKAVARILATPFQFSS